MERGPQFKQSQICHAARLVAGRCLQKARQKRGTHMAHFRRNRIFQTHHIRAAAKERRRFLINKAIGDTFIIPQSGKGAPPCGFTFLHWGQDGAGHACAEAGQGLWRQFGERGDTRHFFHQIRLTLNITPPRGHPNLKCLATAAGRKTKRGQDAHLFLARDVHTDKADHARRVQAVAARRFQRRARLNHI